MITHDTNPHLESFKYYLGVTARENNLNRDPIGPMPAKPGQSLFTIKRLVDSDQESDHYGGIQVDHKFLEEHEPQFISNIINGDTFQVLFSNARNKTIYINPKGELDFSPF